MAKKAGIELESSAEEKIKMAARKLFTQKGFAGVKTRDIAAEAGINLALLNYYFRSKEKLFEIIMFENFQQFILGIASIFNDENLTLDEKIEKIVSSYINMLTQNPDLPFFILNEMRGELPKFASKIEAEVGPMRSHFIKQLQEAMQIGEIAHINPFHFIANMMSLIIFPFIGKPMLQRIGGIDQARFEQLMQERKQLIPIWIKAMLSDKKL